LESTGILPGFEVSIEEVLPFNQTISLKVQGQQVALGFASARHIFMEPIVGKAR